MNARAAAAFVGALAGCASSRTGALAVDSYSCPKITLPEKPPE